MTPLGSPRAGRTATRLSRTGLGAAQAEPASVAITGKLKQPLELSLQSAQQRWPDKVQLKTFPIKDRQESGYALELLHCLNFAQLDTPSDKRNANLAFVCLAVGKDGYLATVALGEILPTFGNRPAYIVWSEDGEKVRLLVTGDERPSRSVYDLKSIQVFGLEPSTSAPTGE